MTHTEMPNMHNLSQIASFCWRSPNKRRSNFLTDVRDLQKSWRIVAFSWQFGSHDLTYDSPLLKSQVIFTRHCLSFVLRQPTSHKRLNIMNGTTQACNKTTTHTMISKVTRDVLRNFLKACSTRCIKSSIALCRTQHYHVGKFLVFKECENML